MDRKESRGGHFREDFPNKDSAAAKYNTVVLQGAGRFDEPAAGTHYRAARTLKQVIEEMK